MGTSDLPEVVRGPLYTLTSGIFGLYYDVDKLARFAFAVVTQKNCSLLAQLLFIRSKPSLTASRSAS
jgi:hypothetical protein